ncbi:metalloprotease PmbA [Taylorella equigenitalis]|uniref:TldE/PmbA protein n=3 Tax=Taylorella equigenitalis TaxID=29575 RepID=A0A654KFY8_TAYEM|nr:metalloprotease PmbA [Taylorella equigenitalis]ADU91342.1 TldE/PmbA protein [Taylorella equigenitalis MCE9]AFN36437.1 putative protease [Taylorella equigenitalis ATCC 35865]ASY31005.1 metalloprotease PmbA [Taylorella equigenitalis]ASY38308.1 metalloprotease PmbA [Taylorella equigenitalis]ASY39837.1 metalloprotease PmbA [Taylorella equigenitalis]
MNNKSEFEYFVKYALDIAKEKGATEAIAEVSESHGLTVSARNKSIETVEEMHDRGLSITVFKGKARASAATSLFTEESIKSTVSHAWDIAKYTAEDPFAGLPEPELYATEILDLDLYHDWNLKAEDAADIAIELEKAALDYSSEITNSDGASVQTGTASFLLGTSNGFLAGFDHTSHSLGLSVIAGKGKKMQRGYWYSSHRNPQRLSSPVDIGEYAAKRTLSRLGARRIKSGDYPVLFEAPIAITLLGSFSQAISGGSLYREMSFLKGALNEKVMSDHLTIVDDPFIKGAFGSGSFDDEGVRTQKRDLVVDGILKGYLLSTYTARKLGMTTTGNAGGSHNMSLHSSLETPDFEGMLRKMGTGLLVTELMGQGINYVTGQYSRGAFGYWVENGVIQYPIAEITIAGNLKDMFKSIVAVGSDIYTKGSKTCGSILIENMSVAGD